MVKLASVFSPASTFLRRSTIVSVPVRRPQWQQTMLRIKDPTQTVPFYQDNFGLKLIHKYHFNEYGFSLYFMGTPLPNMEYPEAGSKESEELLWNYPGVTLEFTHNHDAAMQTAPMNNGNVEPHRGFGHIAVNTECVYKSYERLVSKGVFFQKTPDGGKMKGLSFALDPDGYWIEICERRKNELFTDDVEYNLSQTMIRVKDAERALDFYCTKMGMTRVCEKHMEHGKFSVYFLSSHIEEAEIEGKSEDERWTMMKESFHPFLELTHNWGTETHQPFQYHSGNEEPKGFGHTGFLVDDLDTFCQGLQAQNVSFRKLPSDGNMRGIAFALDPDGYSVELIQRGVTF